MPTKNLAETLFPKARLAVLAELTGAGSTGLHLREIARRAGFNSKTVMRELHALRNAGILDSNSVGRQVIYRLNGRCAPRKQKMYRKNKFWGVCRII